MTPDLSTPEGRAELRALLLDATLLPWTYDEENHDDVQQPYRYGPQVVYSLGDCDIHPVADCSCNHTCRDEAQAAANGKLIAAAVNALDPLLDAFDAAHATIERLTAPVTEEEGRTCAVAYLNFRSDGRDRPMQELLDAFIARRKEPTP